MYIFDEYFYVGLIFVWCVFIKYIVKFLKLDEVSNFKFFVG